MHKKLLESIIALTAERDIEALEYSLLSCMAEMFSCVSLTIIKPVSDHGAGLVREALRLWQDETDGSYKSSKDGELMIPAAELLEAMGNKTGSEIKTTRQYCIFPL